MALYRKSDSKYWWADLTVAGTRLRVSTKKTVKSHAAQVEASLLHKLSLGESVNVRVKAPLLVEFAPTFLDYVDNCRKSFKTKDYYRNGWRLLKTQKIAQMRMDHITTSTGETLQIGGSGSNINCALRTLRRMLSLAAEKKFIAAAPRFHLAEETKRERVFTPLEESIILAKANQTIQDAFLLIMDTGARPAEAAAISWLHVNFMTRSILIPKGKTKHARRWLVMTDRVFEMMKRRAALGNQWVFPSPRKAGQHIAGRSITGMFCQLKRDLGLPAELVLYSARHTFGTDFQASLKDISKTSRQMGHGSIAVTQRYLHPETAETAEAMNERNKLRHVLSHSTFATPQLQ